MTTTTAISSSRDNRVEDTKYLVTEQEWFRGSDLWSTLTVHPTGERPAAAFAVRIGLDGDRVGVLAVIIELTRVSNFLSQLTVGKSASAFILDRDGTAIAAPDVNADEVTPLKLEQPTFPVAVDAIRQAGSAYDPDSSQPYSREVVRDGKVYKTVLTPISFPGWSLVTVVPESEFLGPVQATIRNLLIGLAVLIVFAGLLSAWLAQRLIAAPLIKVVNEIRHVERFDLDKVAAASLAADRDQQPLRRDRRHGAGARGVPQIHPGRPGAAADQRRQWRAARRRGAADERDVHRPRRFHRHVGAAGRPHHSAAVALFRLVSTQIQDCGGTIDKFIGDAVMAFWGAPAPNPDHAVDCCRAALACQRAVEEAGLVDDHGDKVKIRIGINSGDMLVGNIGSELRLNYTVIGDAVNIASRLESTNKSYGSTIIIGPETRRLAGDRIVVRELDRLAVYGRAGGLQIYELLGMAGECEDVREWVAAYEAGLAAWRTGDFPGAIGHFEAAANAKGRCRVIPDDRALQAPDRESERGTGTAPRWRRRSERGYRRSAVPTGAGRGRQSGASEVWLIAKARLARAMGEPGNAASRVGLFNKGRSRDGVIGQRCIPQRYRSPGPQELPFIG